MKRVSNRAFRIGLAATAVGVVAIAQAQEVYVGPQIQQDVGRGNAATNETTAAASFPLGNDVIAGWNDYNEGGVRNGYGTSIDGGLTWVSFSIRPPAPNQAGVEGDPFTIYDPRSGTIWAGGMSFASNGGIFVARRNPGQNTFQPPVMAYTGSTDKTWGAAGPSFLNNNNTMLYVSHQQGNNRSSDMGQTWSSAVWLGSGIGFLPRVGPKGELYIAYWDFGSGVKLKRSLNDGQSFTTHTIATRLDVWGTQDGSRFPGNFRVPSLNYLAVDPVSGVLYCVYFDTTNIVNGQRNVNLYFTKSSDQGTTWATPKVINNDSNPPGDQFFPWVEVDRSGRIHILFFDSRNTVQNDNSLPGWFDQYYMFSDDGGNTWSEVRLTPNSWRSDLDGFGSGFCGDYSGMALAECRTWTSYLTTQNGAPDIYGNRIINPYVTPHTVSINNGTLIAGNAESTDQSDDNRYRVREAPPFLVTSPSIMVTLTGTCGSTTATRMDGQAELSCSATPLSAINQMVEAFNFALNKWVKVSSSIPTSGDSVVTWTITANAQQFLGPNREVRTRVSYYDNGTFSPGWEGRIDRVRVKVQP